jgi:hypothetical protein
MNKVKRWGVVWMIAGCVCAVSADAEKWSGESTPLDWRFSADVMRPTVTEDWDGAYGIEAQYINWLSPQMGIGFALGVQNWNANDEIYSYGESLGGGASYGYAGGLTGRATMVPASVGTIFRLEFTEKWSATAEIRLSYVFVNSNVEYEEYFAYGRQGQIVGGEGYTSDVDMDNNVMLGTVAQLNYRFSKHDMEWFAGITSQVDLVKGTTTLPETPLSYEAQYDTLLRGVGFRVGISAKL